VQVGGQEAHTVFNLLRKWPDFALLEAELKTGRTHQIRVHLASSGFPIAGDEKYGDFALNKQLQKANEQRGALRGCSCTPTGSPSSTRKPASR
jgi:23S rRNA pseudouridine955/2504/2580 synthase